MARMLKRTGRGVRSSPMERRDIIIVLVMLLAAVAVTAFGTDYVVDRVVSPLLDDAQAPAAPSPRP